MSKPERQCKERACFVPQCKSGYRSNKERVAMFIAPSDATRLAEWERNFKREVGRLTPAAVVWEKHFEIRFIVRVFSITVNGVTSEPPRDKPRLKRDTMSTIFTRYLKHILLKISAKRKTRHLCEQKPPASSHGRPASEASELCSAIESAESVSLEGSGADNGALVIEKCTTRRGSKEASAGELVNRKMIVDVCRPLAGVHLFYNVSISNDMDGSGICASGLINLRLL
ncbi:hypothetical protein V5799_026924 [Amblyomma americanum]|uniref:THAP-type domain-containing protein n=1 Tax=Amblyomma americanum TaxID=6943 RepID=A0AAQ4DH70_AMBAM